MEEKLVTKTQGLLNDEINSLKEIGLKNILELKDQNYPCDVYFDVLSQKNIDILDDFILNIKKNIEKINNELITYLNIVDSEKTDNFLSNILRIDIIKIPHEADYDIVIVCSKLTKFFIFKTMKSYAIEFKNKNVVKITKGRGLEYAS